MRSLFLAPLFLAPLLLLAACASGSDAAPAADGVAQADALPDFAERPADAVVIDVRTPGEWSGGIVAGAEKINVNGGNFLAEVQALGLAPDTPLYLYCRSGNRSGKAERELRDAGYTRLVNAGGYSSLVRGGAETTQ